MLRSPLPPRRTTHVALLATAALLACGSASNDDAGARDDGAAAAPAGESERPVTGRSGPLPGTAWVVFGADTVVAEVARTPDERARGLMYRDEVPDGTGMLFVFEDARVRSFWMENTYVPLDIAFMDPAYRIVDIKQMEPETTELTESAAPAMLALEVRQGWFAEHGIEVGDVAEIVFGG